MRHDRALVVHYAPLGAPVVHYALLGAPAEILCPAECTQYIICWAMRHDSDHSADSRHVQARVCAQMVRGQ